MIKKLLLTFLIGLFYLVVGGRVNAADFKADYQVEYFLTENSSQSLSSKVRFAIKITNLRSDVYVKKFSIAFPTTFLIHNVTAGDDRGAVKPEIVTDNDKNRINLEFSDPAVGRNSSNTFTLEFDQDNLFEINGNVWEVIIPTIEDKQDATYSVIVNLPLTTDKKIAIAKPKPSLIKGNRIFWNNPAAKTIYAVFGNTQYYTADLTYNLQNPRLSLAYTDVTFPPDSGYQKVYVDQISPAPSEVFIDQDGNYLGRYYLKPKEHKTIVFKGIIQTMTQPRKEVVDWQNEIFNSQKQYLLDVSDKNWQLDKNEVLPLKTSFDVYRFVVDKLQYNYNRVSGDIRRLGARSILMNPKNAVCSEFSDLFVAQARGNGIMAREIEGYGFAGDNQLRPISLTSDILHSWPEYYDLKDKLWVSVDPTWENTSGIDYYGSFDLNHIVLAIHGKKSDYPYPAGMYKIGDSRDIAIKPIASEPQEIKKVSLFDFAINDNINDKDTYQGKFTIKNEGNVYIYAFPVTISSDLLNINQPSYRIDLLAPLEKKEVVFNYSSKLQGKRAKADLLIKQSQETLVVKTVSIVPYYYQLGWLVGGLLLGAGAVFLILKLLFKKRGPVS